jgi:hypothetical protein
MGMKMIACKTAARITFSIFVLPLAAWAPALASPILVTAPTNNGTIDFGAVLVGSSSSPWILTVQNGGSAGSSLQGTFPGAAGHFGVAAALSFGPLQPNALTSRGYTYTPVVRGSESQSIKVTSNGGTSTITLKGKGVAPVQQTSATNAGLVRIGTTGTAQLTVANVGDGNLSGQGVVSNLHGTIEPGTDKHFSGPGSVNVNLADGAHQSVSYTYTPLDHVINTTTVAIDFTNGNDAGNNKAQSVLKTLSGQGVGPLFASAAPPGSLLDLGDVLIGHQSSVTLAIGNVSTDPNHGTSSFTDLSLLSAAFIGPDAGDFSLNIPKIGMASSANDVLHEGEWQNLSVVFHAKGPAGLHSATLLLFTDQGAPFGGNGDVFGYDVIGTSVAPEPGTLLQASLGSIVLLGWRARRRGNMR